MSSRLSSRLFWADVLACILGPFLMAFHLILNSSRTFFWTDEAFTLLMVKDLSFWQMIDSLKDTINAFPPTYFALLWLWTKVFGTSFLALRAFSTVWLAGVWILLWFMLRSFTSRLPAFLGLVLVMQSALLRFLNTDARPYSLYCLAYLGACYLLMLSLRPASRPNRGLAVGSFLAYAVLVTTHYIGIIYAGVLLGVALGMWFFRRSPSLGLYCVGGLAGASLTVLDVPFYLAQRALGGESSAIASKPTLEDLAEILSFNTYFGRSFWLLIAGIVCVNVLIMGMVKPVARGAVGARA